MAYRVWSSGEDMPLYASPEQLLARSRTALAIITVLVAAVVVVDVLDVHIRPQPTLPAAAYALAMLVAATFFTPLGVLGVAAISMIAQLLVAWHHQSPAGAVAFDQAILAIVGLLAALYSARTRAETALKADRELNLLKLQAVFEGLVEGVVILDRSGTVLNLNPAALGALNMQNDAPLAGKSWQNAIEEHGVELRYLDGRLVPRDEWPAARVLRGETVSDMEAVYVHPVTGGSQVLRYNGRMVRTRGGETALGILTVRDVTSDRQVEALRNSEERFRLIAANSPDTVFHQDLDLRYRWVVNPAPPYAGEQVTGKTDFELFSEEEARMLVEIKRRVLETGTGIDRELWLTSGGTARCFDLFLEPWRDRSGAVVGLAGYGRDVTDQKHAQAQAIEQQRSLAALEERSRLARDLHDSLAQVLSYVVAEAQAARQLLARDQAARAGEYLDQLTGAAQEAVVEIRDFITGVRTGQEIGFTDAVSRLLKGLSEGAATKTELVLPPDLDESALPEQVQSQLLRIIQESMNNVRKHSAAGIVRVSFSCQDGYLEATIEDDGCGFDPDLLAVDSGQHFGLIVMRERAEEVGGCLLVTSAPGQGTRINVRMPMKGLRDS